MSFTDYPSSLESVHVQRRLDNSFFEEIHISGSDLIIYHNSQGVLDADKISVWAANYGLGGGGGSSASSSWASSSISASFAQTASFALNGGGGGGSGVFASQSLVSTQSLYSTQSLQANQATQSLFSTQSIYATSSLSASWASASISSSYSFYSDKAGIASQSLVATQSIYATSSLSASWASSSLTSSVTTTASYAISASNAATWDSSSLIAYIEDLLQATTYYLTATASVNPYYEMRSTGSSVNTNTLTTSSIPDGGYVFSWLTDPAEPHTTVLASGIYQPDFYAKIDNPTGTTTLTPELYLTDASGNIYYELPAGGLSSPLTTTFARYTLNVIVDFPTTMSTTDRLLFRLKCNTTAGTKGFSVEVEGDVLSHLATPLAQISTNIASASYALFAATATSASHAVASDVAISASWASSSISASWTSQSLSSSYGSTSSFSFNANTASSIYAAGSSLSIINTTNYFVGTSLFPVVAGTYLTALTLTMNPDTTAYVKMTLHGADPIYGPVFFMGEYVLQKDDTGSYGQPGNIISQYNQNSNVYLQSLVPDVSYTTGSGVLAIQLKTLSGSFTGSLVYEIRGQFTSINQPYVPITAQFGDTFESYLLGPITSLYAPSPVFSSTPGIITSSIWGIVAIENVNAYTSGSSPALNSGEGWTSAGIIN